MRASKRRTPARATALAFLLLAVLIATQSALAGNAPSVPARATQHTRPKALSDEIQHIIFIVQENRSFDNIFGAYATAQNGVNGSTYGVLPNGETIPLADVSDTNNGYDINHRRDASLISFNSAAMNGFSLIPLSNNTLSGTESYTQLKPSDNSNYWKYANTFVLADNAFGPAFTQTFPNRLYSIAAQADGAIDAPTTTVWGCDAKPNTTVRLTNGSNVFPCFSQSQIETLAPELDQAGVSWKYYTPTITHYNPYEAIQQIRCGNPSCSTYSQEWLQHIAGPNQFVSDVNHGQLPAVSWIAPPEAYSDHPPSSLCAGESWFTDIVNLLMSTYNNKKYPVDYWSHTAIILGFDEFGGFYDHVPPLFVDQSGYGFRIPMLIISPYAYATSNPSNPHVTHTLYDLSSVVRFIETVFNLPLLDNGHDRDAIANNMLDAFNFNMAPIPPQQLTPRCTINLQSPPPASGYIDNDPD